MRLDPESLKEECRTCRGCGEIPDENGDGYSGMMCGECLGVGAVCGACGAAYGDCNCYDDPNHGCDPAGY